VRAADRRHGFVLMSDLGGRLYLPHCASAAHRLYEDALDALLAMLVESRRRATCLPTNEARLVQEMELLSDWFCSATCGFTPSCEEWDVVETAFRALVENRAAAGAGVRATATIIRATCWSARPALPASSTSRTRCAARSPTTSSRCCATATSRGPDEQVYAWVEDTGRASSPPGLTRVDEETFRRGFDLMACSATSRCSASSAACGTATARPATSRT
jgi:aminoglycoside/choline kinase family phosphotransferase